MPSPFYKREIGKEMKNKKQNEERKKKSRRRNSYLPRFGYEQNKREIHEIKVVSIKVSIVVREKT